MDVCNYCHEGGHWKAECPGLQAKTKGIKSAPVTFGECKKPNNDLSIPAVLDDYIPFIRDGFVSLAEGEDKVPDKILRDTAADDSDFDTF